MRARAHVCVSVCQNCRLRTHSVVTRKITYPDEQGTVHEAGIVLEQDRSKLEQWLKDPNAVPENQRRIAHLKFIATSYKPQYWWFEVTECFRRILLSAALVFITPGTPVALLSFGKCVRGWEFLGIPSMFSHFQGLSIPTLGPTNGLWSTGVTRTSDPRDLQPDFHANHRFAHTGAVCAPDGPWKRSALLGVQAVPEGGGQFAR